MTRAYTVAEIDQMRRALRPRVYSTPRKDYEHAIVLEEMLRTYMLAGVCPEELTRECGRLLENETQEHQRTLAAFSR